MTTTPNPDETAQASSPITVDPSSTVTPNSDHAPTSRLGMERGYSLSPMYSLILEYNKEQGSNLSTAAEVSWILQKPCLKQQDIERIEGESDPHNAVRMVDSELQPILRVVTELQVFLDRMAQLIEERTTVFRIDPRETMTSALQGCASRFQLEVAHKILLKCLLVAQQTIAKYETQYRQMEAPLSPLSTVPDLYDEFNNIESVDGRMRFMLDNMPHHQSQILPAAREALKDWLEWDVIYPTLPLPFASSQPPELPQNQHTAKKKVDWEDTAPWEGASSSLEQGRDLEEGPEPSFGFQTPFKKGTRFFDTSDDGPSSVYFSTPGLMFTQDVIVGLATPSRTELSENVREYNTNQGTSVSVVTRRASSVAHTTTATPASNPLAKNNSQIMTNVSNGTARNPSDSGGGNDPPRGSGNGPSRGSGDGPPHPGGGGGGPPNRGGGRGGGNAGGNHPSWPPHPNGSPSGGGGGGGGDPGGGGGPPFPNNGLGPPAPYGNIPASIKTELKVEQLPEWDGNHWTAIDYFWQIQQLAYLGGWLPEALGYWLWFRLKEDSAVRRWFVTLPVTHQSYMRSHYLRFLKGIKDGFLGHR